MTRVPEYVVYEIVALLFWNKMTILPEYLPITLWYFTMLRTGAWKFLFETFLFHVWSARTYIFLLFIKIIFLVYASLSRAS